MFHKTMEHGGSPAVVGSSDDAARAIAELSKQLAHPLRVVLLKYVLEYGPCPFSELVEAVGMPQARVSNHLSVLRKAGLVVTQRHGRQSLYRLPNSYVAEVLANLQAAAGVSGVGPDNRPETCEARCCYDHVGGRLGVALLFTLLQRSAVEGDPLGPDDLTVGPAAESVFAEFRVPGWQDVRGSRRRFAYGCPDWTEKAPHLGGALGAAVASSFLAHDWVRPRAGSRALELTDQGRTVLREAGVSL